MRNIWQAILAQGLHFILCSISRQYETKSEKEEEFA